ncbi:hypothetical protein Tco_0550459 [Tanacetum coccineum]
MEWEALEILVAKKGKSKAYMDGGKAWTYGMDGWTETLEMGNWDTFQIYFFVFVTTMFLNRAVDNGQKLYMGNSATADIKGEGDLCQLPRPKDWTLNLLDCIFIGYAKNNTAYRFIVHESKNPDIQKNTIMESRNASFFENIFPCLSKETGSSSRLDDKVVQDKRQRGCYESPKMRDKDQTVEEEVDPEEAKGKKREIV